MSTRVSPTEELRAEIDELYAPTGAERQLGGTLAEVARIGPRLLLQRVLEIWGFHHRQAGALAPGYGGF
ncbi:MAG: hypothetical protein ACRET5_00065 [Steroidobacteraceae bacterium]